LEFLSLLLFHRIGLNHIAMGPSALIFAVLYQYSRIVPSAYSFRIFGVPLNNKSLVYVLALQVRTELTPQLQRKLMTHVEQMAISRLPSSAAVALIGVFTGQIYRSDLTNLKAYRISPSVVNVSTRFLLPLIGSLRPPRRSNRAFPDNHRSRTSSSSIPQNEEVITTARVAPTTATWRGSDDADDSANNNENGPSVVREWVDELTGRAERASTGIRVPPEAEIMQLTSMFPDVQREVIVGALQRR
jgi:hypothetical protein